MRIVPYLIDALKFLGPKFGNESFTLFDLLEDNPLTQKYEDLVQGEGKVPDCFPVKFAGMAVGRFFYERYSGQDLFGDSRVEVVFHCFSASQYAKQVIHDDRCSKVHEENTGKIKPAGQRFLSLVERMRRQESLSKGDLQTFRFSGYMLYRSFGDNKLADFVRMSPDAAIELLREIVSGELSRLIP